MTDDTFPEPMLLEVTPGDQTLDLLQRQNFCRETYKALAHISGPRGWYFRPRQQFLMKKVGDYVVVGFMEFARNSNSTWVDVEFEPLGLTPLAFEIVFNKIMKWDVELRSDHLTTIPVPSVEGAGWKDFEISPEENASKLIDTIEQIANRLPTQAAFSDFLRSAKHPSSHRFAEAVSLILEGKHHAARELIEGIRRGDVRRTGAVVDQEILNWLNRVPVVKG